MPRPWLFVGSAPALAEGYLLDRLARDRTEMAHRIAHRDDREGLRIGRQPQRVVDFLLVEQVARGEVAPNPRARAASSMFWTAG